MKNRLKELVDEFCDGQPAVFAKKCSIPPSTFHYYIKGRSPSVQHLIHIHERFKINLHWLIIGEGPKYCTYEMNDNDLNYKIEDIYLRLRKLESSVPLEPEKHKKGVTA